MRNEQRREVADQIARRMTSEGHQVSSLHGAKDAAERDQIIDSFRDGKSKVLITTNVVARGIDILQVNMVVNYDLPLTGSGQPDAETYLHRIGELLRTALSMMICGADVRLQGERADSDEEAFLLISYMTKDRTRK
jgi:superfamily II DNA/RNA helicase